MAEWAGVDEELGHSKNSADIFLQIVKFKASSACLCMSLQAALPFSSLGITLPSLLSTFFFLNLLTSFIYDSLFSAT